MEDSEVYCSNRHYLLIDCNSIEIALAALTNFLCLFVLGFFILDLWFWWGMCERR